MTQGLEIAMGELDVSERERTRDGGGAMTQLLERAIDVVRAMPDGEQDQIAQAILTLLQDENDDAIDPDHLQDALEGLAEIERGEIATEAEVEAAFRSFRR